ncbi:hypothetical protein SDJN02_06373, partial [Cucurbita argyrosperma subsp. argyrosperma]
MVLSRASLFNALRKALDLILVGPKHEEFRRVSDPILSKSRMDLFNWLTLNTRSGVPLLDVHVPLPLGYIKMACNYPMLRITGYHSLQLHVYFISHAAL